MTEATAASALPNLAADTPCATLNGEDILERKTPSWFDEAKFGIFIHWSPAAIPAYAPLASNADVIYVGNSSTEHWPNDPDGISKTWRRLPHAICYENNLLIADSPTQRYHKAKYGDAGYETFVAQFRDQVLPACDPTAWADLCARAGARYAVLTTKHQDGFVMWPTKNPSPKRENWQVPTDGRDVVGDFAEALRDKGIRFGAYYCAGVDDTFGDIPIRSNQHLIEYGEALAKDDEYVDYVTAHWHELIDRYKPSIIWNDYSYPGSREQFKGLVRTYLSKVPEGVVNNRFQALAGGTHLFPCPTFSDFTTPEYRIEGSPDEKWETCRSVGLSFGYNALESQESYLEPATLIRMLADVVSRGGNMLLNINPTATGEIPWGEAERLLAVGYWLQTNGEAIYGTRPWIVHAGLTLDAQQVRYTQNDEAVYAIVLGTPPRPGVELDVRLDEGAEVRLVGLSAPLTWRNTPVGVEIELPEQPADRPALSLRLSPSSAVSRVVD